MTMQAIGSRRDLFVDYLLVDRLEGTSLKLYVPQPGGVAVRFGASEKDSDDHIAFYTTVLRDGDTFRIDYRGKRVNRTDRGFESLTCYTKRDC